MKLLEASEPTEWVTLASQTFYIGPKQIEDLRIVPIKPFHIAGVMVIVEPALDELDLCVTDVFIDRQRMITRKASSMITHPNPPSGIQSTKMDPLPVFWFNVNETISGDCPANGTVFVEIWNSKSKSFLKKLFNISEKRAVRLHALGYYLKEPA